VSSGLAGAARANVWTQAIAGDHATAEEQYELAMDRGDQLLQQASQRDLSLRAVEILVGEAENAYREAASARPDSGEPYYRIGEMLYDFYIGCDADWRPATCDPSAARLEVSRRIVAAWEAFEKRSPLDPRVTALLTDRAILRTKLVATADAKQAHVLLEAAMRDYQAALDRWDGVSSRASTLALVWGNLAETYMMLDRLDDAIAAYGNAIRHGGGTEVVYGLAVALDRDERARDARDLIVDHGVHDFEIYRDAINRGLVFYVPDGEQYYYFALCEEAFGDTAEAAADWTRYIQSNAHPEFQPRAREHLAALAKQPRLPSHLPSANELMP
jgi:tetratricopeptide (TPR) repeat protein